MLRVNEFRLSWVESEEDGIEQISPFHDGCLTDKIRARNEGGGNSGTQ